jgi:hypothetical protein
VGSPDDVREVLRSLRTIVQSDGTNLGAAIRTGVSMLNSAAGREEGHRRVLVVLSDGHATAPVPDVYAARYALDAAELARDQDVQIYAFALGGDPDGAALLEQLADVTGGDFWEVDSAGDVVEHLPHARFAGIESIDMQNLTAQRAGRAVRMFADGSFDGFVPLVPGDNQIEVTVRSRTGEPQRLHRTIRFEPGSTTSPENLESIAELSRALQIRSLESELAARARDAHRVRRLTIVSTP